jgi:hypothetical protein
VRLPRDFSLWKTSRDAGKKAGNKIITKRFIVFVDGSSINPGYVPLLTGEVMAVSASVMAFAAVVASKVRRHAVRLHNANKSHLQWGKNAGPLLSGIYRGRSVEMTLAENGLLFITARTVNRANVASEFATGDRLPISWLPTITAYRLKTLPGHWSVSVRGQHLFFSCQLADNDPERMRRALELTCDLADAVDGTL